MKKLIKSRMNIQIAEIDSSEKINTETLIEDISEISSLGLTPAKNFIFGEAVEVPTRNIWKIIGYKNTVDEGKVYYVKDSLGKEEELGTLEEIREFFREKIFQFID